MAAIALLVILAVSTAGLAAASPLTATPFFEGYRDLAPVQRATGRLHLDDELSDFLLDESTPIGEAIAVVSALDISPAGEQHHPKRHHIDLLVRLRQTDPGRFDDFRRGKGSPRLLVVVGHAWSRSEFMHPEKGLALLRAAQRRMPGSFSATFIRSLAESEIKSNDGNLWCEIYEDTHGVLDDWSGPVDMRKAAIDAAMEYMDLYGPYCG